MHREGLIRPDGLLLRDMSDGLGCLAKQWCGTGANRKREATAARTLDDMQGELLSIRILPPQLVPETARKECEGKLSRRNHAAVDPARSRWLVGYAEEYWCKNLYRLSGAVRIGCNSRLLPRRPQGHVTWRGADTGRGLRQSSR